jgi:hypothetical protein
MDAWYYYTTGEKESHRLGSPARRIGGKDIENSGVFDL